MIYSEDKNINEIISILVEIALLHLEEFDREGNVAIFI